MRVRQSVVGAILGMLGLVLVLGPAQVGARNRHRHRRHGAGTIYRNRSYTPAERAADLVARLTLQEKASEMIAGESAAIPRLGVQSYGWWNEAGHGLYAEQILPDGTTAPGQPQYLNNTTVYPDDLSLGSSWDPALMYRESSAISDEARELAPEQFRDLDFFSPTVNLSRDPRWGRNDETFSEDPLLTADMGAQFVNGLEGKDMRGRLLRQGGGYLKAIATLKHYAANNSEFNRETGSSNVDEATLREYYTAQFRQIIAKSQPGAIMSAFNEVNGTPAPASAHLIDTLARQTYGFRGYFTSDCDAVDDIVAGHDWQAPRYHRPVTPTEARAIANAAGEDLNCNLFYLPLNYANALPTAFGIRTPTGRFTVNDMDESLVRLFAARIGTGEFDNVNAQPWVRRARTELNGFRWSNDDSNGAVTETSDRLALSQDAAVRSQVLLKNDVTRRRDRSVGRLLPIQVPSGGAFKVAVIGHEGNRAPPNGLFMGDYASHQGVPGQAKEVTPYGGIRSAIQAIDPSAQVDFYQGFTTGDAASTLTNINSLDVNAAANYDYVIVDVGTDWSTSGERQDRFSLELPGAQAQLIRAVAARNPNTIVTMQTSGDVNVADWQSAVPAIMWSSFGGQREGAALGDALVGRYNPSGHLPFTWYQSDSELPPIGDYRIRPGPGRAGRTYMYFRGAVSYPFGYGLSYTTFSASDLHVSSTHLTADDTVRASAKVKNTGTRAGEDLVQLYVTTPGRGAPQKRLEGFQQIYLPPGRTRSVTLAVKLSDLALWAGSHFAVRDGNYKLEIASSAQDVQLSRSVHVRGRLTRTPSVVTASPQMPGDHSRGIPERIMFPVGTVIDPHLTVAMNDSSLYGYIGKRRSRGLPAGARVRYSSDNPGVVSVSNGAIRTVANGAATITASVTYNGVTATGQFVVRALSELNQLGIKGRAHKVSQGHHKKTISTFVPLRGFHPDTFVYRVIVPSGRPIPHLVASCADRRAHVHISQTATVPGTAQITVSGPDGITESYTVNFTRS
jgi:beta-glucosidase